MINCVHPGLIMTNLMRRSFAHLKVIQVISYIFWKNVARGAVPACYVGLNPQLKGVTGKYFVDKRGEDDRIGEERRHGEVALGFQRRSHQLYEMKLRKDCLSGHCRAWYR